MRNPSRLRDPLLLALAVVIVLALFAGKAFTIDDPLFLWLGAHLQSDPADFFGFSVNWYGTAQPMYEVTRNPALGGYYVALAAALFGWSEVALHLAFLPPAAVVAATTWSLARRLGPRPLEAGLIGLFTPAFLVSSTNVMCDTLMLAFYCGALRCWIAGLDRERAAWLLAAAGLATCAFLTKYFGLSLVPLFLAYGWARCRRPGAWTVFALLPLAALAAYEAYTTALYGSALLTDAALYATSEAAESATPWGVRALVGLVFAGGCLAPALLYAPLLWSWRFVAGALLVTTLLVLATHDDIFRNTEVEYVPVFTYVQLFAMAIGGCSLIALAVGELVRARDPDALLLGLWVLGTLVFAGFFNWVNNGRSNLPAAPALGILLMRHLERLRSADRPRLAAARWTAFAAAAAVAVAVTWSDYRWAGEVRHAAAGINHEFAKRAEGIYFLGHWGFQYYMEKGGARAMRFGVDRVTKSDLLVIPSNNTELGVPEPEHAEPLARMIHREPRGLRTNSVELSAGFYSSGVGSLPFVFGVRGVDAYYVLRPKGVLGAGHGLNAKTPVGEPGRGRQSP